MLMNKFQQRSLLKEIENTVIPSCTAPGYTAKLAYHHNFTLYGIFLLYKAFNCTTTHFVCEAVTKGRMVKWISVTKLIFLTGALEL